MWRLEPDQSKQPGKANALGRTRWTLESAQNIRAANSTNRYLPQSGNLPTGWLTTKLTVAPKSP